MKIILVEQEAWEALISSLAELTATIERLTGEEPIHEAWLDNGDVCQFLSISKRTLQSYLKDYHPQRLGDEAFIAMRSERAAEVYEEAFLRGSNPYEAHNEAIATLLEGLEFSPYMVVEDIVEQELNLSIPSELNAALSKLLMAHPEVRKFLDSFDFTDDFEDKAEFQDFRNELIGLLAEIVAGNKLLSALQTS